MPKKHLVDDLFCSLKSPTPWNSVEYISKELLSSGFVELKENDIWKINPENKYFVTRNGSSLCAFITPQKKPQKSLLLGTHTDSPALKLKPNAEFRVNNYILFGVEVYGEPLLSSWLNRDLGIAGRVVTKKNNTLSSHIVNITDAPCMIAQLAVHLDRDVNEKGLILNKQDHLSAIMALDDKSSENYLEKILNPFIKNEPILSHDLFLYPLQVPSFLGKNKEMIASYRLDNLVSAQAALTSLIHTSQKNPSQETIKMALFWDNEEIGSKTAQGAGSSFLSDTLGRIYALLKLSFEEQSIIKANSLCVSIDVSHAVHPNYPTKHEPRHPLLLGEGIAIKNNAHMRYATDALSAALIIDLCKQKKIPVQKFVSRTDIPSGSTIGPIHANRNGMKTVDIGIPQLSMHSSREIIAIKDYEYLCTLLQSLLDEEVPTCF
ncbi:MAG: M18 family aminopeptidase [Chlamydiales bacterium]|nr:M18 family aminopeptidase [Chlamydiales bacterium]